MWGRMLAVACLGLFLVKGCDLFFFGYEGRMSAVEGPLSEQKHSSLNVRLTWNRHSHEVTAEYPDGKTLIGNFVLIKRSKHSKGSTPSDAFPQDALLPAWNDVYGTTYYPRHVARARYLFRATLVGTGATLRLEFYPSTQFFKDNDFQGVGQDSNGNYFIGGVSYSQAVTY